MASARHPAYDGLEASTPYPEAMRWATHGNLARAPATATYTPELARAERSAGLGTISYGFGLRHAFDADHIAAIDNTTRRTLQDGERSLSVGFFFSLGHTRLDATRDSTQGGDR